MGLMIKAENALIVTFCTFLSSRHCHKESHSFSFWGTLYPAPIRGFIPYPAGEFASAVHLPVGTSATLVHRIVHCGEFKTLDILKY